MFPSHPHSGLTDDQLYDTFQLLEHIQNASEIYDQWISCAPVHFIDPSIRSYSGINLCNPYQRDQHLFPLFRFNMLVIDFWLSQTVFPREAKTFEQKLMCSAWDLCSDTFDHHVTGFSGTNDTRNILPLPIRQHDLEVLENTNANVRAILLLPENQLYQRLPANVSGKEILDSIIANSIPVLLDAGALMLELSNEQVAKEWLNKTSDVWYDAAVYFDDRDDLLTLDRNGSKAKFDQSVFRDKLDRCLVYLDDVHTRGTDLKFPISHRACVTLSGDITRDKTVQACMRMRKLGKGQTIAFYASHEADIRIREACELLESDDITNEHVMKFIEHNSRQMERENMVHWSVGAVNYTKKVAGYQMHGEPMDEIDEAALRELYESCVDTEFVTLNELYGDKTDTLLSDIASAKFDILTKSYSTNRLTTFIPTIRTNVIERIKLQAPEVRRFIQTLDDQQEKELEHEMEQERQVQRPVAADACVPELADVVEEFIESGNWDELDEDDRDTHFIPMSVALKNTTLFHRYAKNPKAWSKHLYVTADFLNVIDKRNNVDEFLRPVWWIAKTRIDKKRSILTVLSSFECDRLMTIFADSQCSTLFMYRPRISQIHSNLLDVHGLSVTGNTKEPVDPILMDDAVQIGMFAGSMYFASNEEQNAYCSFMGLIPRPRTTELETQFRCGQICANGFVEVEHRRSSQAINARVGACRFEQSPTDLAVKLIEAHHEMLSKECHVAWILKKGIMKDIA